MMLSLKGVGGVTLVIVQLFWYCFLTKTKTSDSLYKANFIIPLPHSKYVFNQKVF